MGYREGGGIKQHKMPTYRAVRTNIVFLCSVFASMKKSETTSTTSHISIV